MHDAFILAAGFGTRLRPLTHLRPKPLVPVCGVPMLAYALALCARHDLRRVIVNAHHLGEQLDAWGGRHEGCDVTIVHEHPDILGTGGGLRHVADRLAERFAVVNGDTLCDVDLRALLDAVPDGGGAMALRVHPDDARDRYGIVVHDAAGRVTDIKQLGPPAEPVGAEHRDAHFTGVHAMHRDMLDHVPEGFSDIVRTAYIAEVPRRNVAALRHTGTWLDVGDPRAYLDTNRIALTGAAPLPLDPWARADRGQRSGGSHLTEGGRLEGPVWIGADAVVHGEVERSVVGAGARVPPGARLVDCVVWEGVEVPDGTWSRHVFTAAGPVAVPDGSDRST